MHCAKQDLGNACKIPKVPKQTCRPQDRSRYSPRSTLGRWTSGRHWLGQLRRQFRLPSLDPLEGKWRHSPVLEGQRPFCGACSAGRRSYQKRWKSIAASWDKSTIKIYMNGKLMGSKGYSGAFNAVDKSGFCACVGEPGRTHEAFNGEMRNVQIMDKALSDTAVKGLPMADSGGSNALSAQSPIGVQACQQLSMQQVHAQFRRFQGRLADHRPLHDICRDQPLGRWTSGSHWLGQPGRQFPLRALDPLAWKWWHSPVLEGQRPICGARSAGRRSHQKAAGRASPQAGTRAPSRST